MGNNTYFSCFSLVVLLQRNSTQNEENIDSVKLPLKNINAWLLVIFFMLQSGLFMVLLLG